MATIRYPNFIQPKSSAMEIPILTQDDLKRIAAHKAVEFVRSIMVVGLGTGSTAKHAVDLIADLLRQGKLTDIVGIPTSTVTHEQAQNSLRRRRAVRDRLAKE